MGVWPAYCQEDVDVSTICPETVSRQWWWGAGARWVGFIEGDLQGGSEEHKKWY